MRELTGKTAVVTGAASGIGYALAARCASKGMNVVLADVDAAGLEVAADKLHRPGVEVLSVLTDVSSGESVDALAEATFARFGTAHLVCNNAGVAIGGPLWKVPQSVWDWVLGVNLAGVVHGVRAFVPRLVKQGEGHVVNTASILGVVAAPMFGPYVASKHAVVGLSEVLLHDLMLVGSPVRVSVACPSWVNTGITDSERAWPDRLGPPPAVPRGSEGARAAMRQVVENGLDPDDVAAAVLDAVEAGRFWVFPQDGLAGAAVERMQAAANGEEPSVPWSVLQQQAQ